MSSPIAKSVKKLASRSTSRHSAAASSPRKRVVAGKSTRLKPATKRSPAGKARARKAPKLRTAKPRAKPPVASAKRPAAKPRTKAKKAVKTAPKVKHAVTKAPVIFRKPVPPLPPPQPTHDEAAALRAFEAAHKEFARGRFAEARNQFRSLVESFSTVAEVTARARTYLAVAEARLRTELALPKDADSLYDRGVIELNRGEYVAAQELFERALRREDRKSV